MATSAFREGKLKKKKKIPFLAINTRKLPKQDGEFSASTALSSGIIKLNVITN